MTVRNASRMALRSLEAGVRRKFVVLVTDVLEDLLAGRELPCHGALDWPGECCRVLEPGIDNKLAEIGAPVPLGHGRHRGMRRSCSDVSPGFIVEAVVTDDLVM